ncbi:MAG: beta-N-acetylhexosaminidase [Nitratireductor sp.]|nr:beta-N-acetylhexosaminidase [Nitratireductor sp.]MCC0019764.1 beta-N-acetylhexosaminidase [Nitratireductor sp.]
MGIKAFITGVAGLALSHEERAFIENECPWGLILFARNISDPKQVSKLVDEFRDAVHRADAPVLIDQEGGRVQRLRPPHWQSYATGRALGDIWRKDKATGERALWLHSRLIAHDLYSMGINVDCLPVLDVPVAGSHDVIGDRAYSSDPQEVATMGRIACTALMEGGVLPVVKHIPGHGRAGVDSHKSLPEVHASHAELSALDFVPFKALNDMPLAMTAHIRYHALDGTAPATTSAHVIGDIIRGEIGFDGMLMSDDLSMEALAGTLAERADASFAAGCDMALHCNGIMSQMEEVASVCPVLEGKALERAASALSRIGTPQEIDVDALREEYRQILEPVA